MDRSPELERLVADWFAAASRGDVSLIAAHVPASEHVRLIGSDPAELFSGGGAVAAFLRGEVEHAGGKAHFKVVSCEAFREGSVGWANASVRITLADGRSVAPRWSSVFRLEEGVWSFVQTHASFGVPNEAVGWVYTS